MQYLLQIYSGDAIDAFERLSEDEQKSVMGEYFAISELPGVIGGNAAPAGRDGHDGPGPGRPDAHDRRPVRRRPRRSSAATTCSRPMTSTRRSSSRRGSPRRGMGGAVEVRPVVER